MKRLHTSQKECCKPQVPTSRTRESKTSRTRTSQNPTKSRKRKTWSKRAQSSHLRHVSQAHRACTNAYPVEQTRASTSRCVQGSLVTQGGLRIYDQTSTNYEDERREYSKDTTTCCFDRENY